MGQVTIYLENALEEKMRISAKTMRLSQSKWVANLIREKLHNEWPNSIIELAGAWENFPSAEEIRIGMGTDVKREVI